ncbi:T9SS type A sorting domain-containing protein [Bacteroides sp.]|uniref:T9SS type A sorting domain-containing protein n=1 Tax=Bacteroides sp. TaxID=29523 RepID=UPI0025C5DE32|nr:T9SS type A sorting domain-containing protein [Bacteroides sp.]
MKKLLLGMFTVLALNVQGQSLTDTPVVIRERSEIAHFFVDKPFLYTITESNKDYIVDIYNDELQKSKQFTVKNAVFNREDNMAYGIVNLDMDNLTGYDAYSGSLLSQYLFNDDDKIEYVFCTIKKQITGEQYEYILQKAEVINEDGEVLGTLPVEAIEFYVAYDELEISVELTQIGDNYYIMNDEELDGPVDPGEPAYNTTYWKLNKSKGGSGVSFTKTASFKSYPNPVRQNETFTIEVGEENVASGNFIELCDQSGRMVYRQAITSSEVKVPTRRMKGMYIYNIVSGGKAISTGKVIVQ